MPKAIASPDKAAERWANNLASAADYWRQQVEAASWKQYAASDTAEKNYADEMQKVIAEKRRKTAVEQTSDEVWKSGVRAAAATFGTNVRAASTKVQAFMSKFLPDVDSIRKALPPRGARGSDRNILERSAELQRRLAKNRGKYKVRGVAKSAT
jgi:hypothetical protein